MTSSPQVQWRQDANGVWEYLASDGNWYAANPAAGTPVPPSGMASAPQGPGYNAPGVVYAPSYQPPTMVCPRCGTYYDPKKRACPNCAALTGAPQLELANAGLRFGQYLLDVVLAIVTLFIGYLVWSLIIWDRGQTPAMQILHIRAVKKDTLDRTGMGTMALREVVGRWIIMGAIAAVFFPAWVVLCFMLLWDEDRQELWDKIAGTIVVNGDPPPAVPVGQPMPEASAVAGPSDPGALTGSTAPQSGPGSPETETPESEGQSPGSANPQPSGWSGSEVPPAQGSDPASPST